MPIGKKPYDRTTIITTLILVVGTITAAFFTSPWIIDYIKPSPPKPTPTATPSPSPGNGTSPLPLAEVFPQVGPGKEFLYINLDRPDALKKQFVNDEECRHSGPFGLKLTYRFIGGGHGGWGVGWKTTPAGSFDASELTYLSFWVKGLKGTEKFQVSLKDTRDKENRFDSDSLAVSISNWTKIDIPLSRFTDIKLNAIENINFGFNSNHGSGSICIDDIAFIK